MNHLDHLGTTDMDSASVATSGTVVRCAINYDNACPVADRNERHSRRTTASDQNDAAILQDTALPRVYVREAESAVRADFPRVNGNHAMTFHRARLRGGCVMVHTVVDDGSLTVVYGEGGGCALDIHGSVEAVFIPLCRSLQITLSRFASVVCRGEVLVTEYDTHIKVVGHGRAQWLALLGGKQAWARLLGSMEVCPALGTRLLPARHAASRNLRRHAIALARTTQALSLESAANAVIDGILELQAPLFDAISRCPGRTHAKQLEAFLRLQRVRNFISSYCDQHLDNDALACMANYAPTHFIRIFNEAFLETPHDYLIEQRLRLAVRLLHSSNLAVREVALAIGFENRSAFSRRFRQRFGVTANEARHRFQACAGG